MHDKDDFLKNIPPFLRRTQEPSPRPAPAQAVAAPAQAEAAPAKTAEAVPPPTAKAPLELPPVPAVKPGGTLPWLAQRKAEAKDTAPEPVARAPVARAAVEKAVEKVVEQPAPKAPNAVRESQSRIERELSREPVAEPGPGEADAPFQVTLPRGVIRQIRIRAAEEGTTHRAIVLRALRLAGLAVPEGLDVDRRKPAVKQRQTA